MTIIDRPTRAARAESYEPQRFIFDHADWAFYERIDQALEDRRAFITYYKGRLEVVTTSLLHDSISRLLYRMIATLAEETDTPLKSAGAATLRRRELNVAVQADESFYLRANEERMRGKQVIDLAVDPPPDLAVEVEVSRRLGVRQSIYLELGVPEVWRYSDGMVVVLLKRDGEDYVPAERSPTFPQISPQELAGFVASGLGQDETQWIKTFRRRVREVLDQR